MSTEPRVARVATKNGLIRDARPLPPFCSPVDPIEEETFDDGDRSRIMGFTGYVKKYMDPSSDPSLLWYSQVS